MKVVILGPAVNEVSSGGVAVFSEGLYNGFKENGHETFLISAQKSSTIDNIVIDGGLKKQNQIVFKTRKIAKILKGIQPDLVIGSLQYNFGIKKYRRACPKATFVRVDHGFACPINGSFKAFVVNRTARYFAKHFDKMVSVSFLSYAVNTKINRVRCDCIIENGCNLYASGKRQEPRYDFVYVGRLYRDKEVEMIADAFIKAKRKCPELRFAVAGYGELSNEFLAGRFKCQEIDFLGKLDQAQVSDLFSRTKFLISMNPLEPFGIVFAEAISNGCNIVTQSTSGFASGFAKKDYYHFADVTKSDELSNRILEIKDQFVEIDPDEIESLKKRLSFKSVAKKYESLVSK